MAKRDWIVVDGASVLRMNAQWKQRDPVGFILAVSGYSFF